EDAAAMARNLICQDTSAVANLKLASIFVIFLKSTVEIVGPVLLAQLFRGKSLYDKAVLVIKCFAARHPLHYFPFAGLVTLIGGLLALFVDITATEHVGHSYGGAGRTRVLLKTPNSRRLQTLTFDPSQPQIPRSLKLSLIPDHGNPDAFYFTANGKLLSDDSIPIGGLAILGSPTSPRFSGIIRRVRRRMIATISRLRRRIRVCAVVGVWSSTDSSIGRDGGAVFDERRGR
ncbi:unnamed protein product, partial [Linum tenue]